MRDCSSRSSSLPSTLSLCILLENLEIRITCLIFLRVHGDLSIRWGEGGREGAHCCVEGGHGFVGSFDGTMVLKGWLLPPFFFSLVFFFVLFGCRCYTDFEDLPYMDFVQSDIWICSWNVRFVKALHDLDHRCFFAFFPRHPLIPHIVGFEKGKISINLLLICPVEIVSIIWLEIFSLMIIKVMIYIFL